MLCCVRHAVPQAVLSSPEKVAYMKERIPLGRLGEPEDVVGAADTLPHLSFVLGTV